MHAAGEEMPNGRRWGTGHVCTPEQSFVARHKTSTKLYKHQLGVDNVFSR
jgi:hypothetical protein